MKLLDENQREQLKLAHRYSVAQYVKLPGNRFIGCHVNGARHLIVEDFYNDWYIGTINYPSEPNGVQTLSVD